jgi:hypothetical protein
MAAHLHFARGFAQRQSRHLYQDGEMVEALNVLPNALGAVTTRPGHTVFAGPLDQLHVTAIHTAYNTSGVRRVYAQAGTKLYRNGVAIATPLASLVRMTFANIRGFGEQTLYTYFAASEPSLLVKDDGTTLTSWGINPPSAAPSVTTGSGSLTGTYRWRVTFLRKAIPPNVRYGTWNGTSFTDQTGGALTVASTTNNHGHIVGAAQPFAEIFYLMTIGASGGSPVYVFQYWNGLTWVNFTPGILPNFAATGRTRATLTFPTTNWRPQVLGGHFLYAIRMLATTAPTTTAPVANPVTLYDSVIASESNPSEASAQQSLSGQGGALSGIPNPTTSGVDLDGQVTHVGIYRTVANVSEATDPFLFSQDMLAGITSVTDTVADGALLGTLAFDNDRPQVFQAVCEHQNRLWGLRGNTVYPSKYQQPEAFPVSLAFDVGTLSDPPLTLWSEGGVLYVATAARVYQIVGFGQDASGQSLYVPQETLWPTGIGATGSIAHGARADYFLGSDGVFWRVRGPSIAENFSDERLYPLFHGQAVAGQLPLHQAFRSTAVSGFYPSRILFSYPHGDSTVPSSTLVYDELTDTWYRDSRGFRCFHYDRIANELLAGTVDGRILTIAQTGAVSTDAGTTIQAFVQTKDDDNGRPDADKQVVELLVDAEQVTPAVTAVLNFTGQVVLGSTTHTSRSQQYLSGQDVIAAGRALGYLVSWTGPGTLYRLIPHLLPTPPTRKVFRTVPSDLGWPGRKILSDFLLDVEWLETGDITVTFRGDTLLSAPVVHTRVFRGHAGTRVRLPRERLPATPIRLLTVEVRGTGQYRLWPGSHLHWRALGGQPGLQTLSLVQE